MARLLVCLTSLLVLTGCGSAARADWSRGPYTSASQEFQRDQYECRRDALRLAPVPSSTGAESYGVTGPRGDTYTVRQSGLGAGVQSAGASMGAGIQQRRILEECLRARGWTTSLDAPAQATATTSPSAAARPKEPVEVREAIARAKAERYQQLDQLDAPSRPTTRPPITTAPSLARSEPWFRGASGPVEWEVTAIEQNRNAGETLIHWTYEVVLRDREGLGLQFETMELASEGPRTRTAPRSYPFRRRLDPRGGIRYQDSY
jgi:hypothetical protein